MNNPNPASAGFPADFMRDLRAFAILGEETLALAAREHQALCSVGHYESFEFYSLRKDLLARLEPLIIGIKHWRKIWQQINPVERVGCSDVKAMIQSLQNLLGKILQLDRENQQALLRRGLVPARHVTSCAAPSSNYVANLYRRHSTSNSQP